MRVYVETNFLLEIVLLQEQHQSCDEIIALCQSASIPLTPPRRFSVPEAYSTLGRKAKTPRTLCPGILKIARAELVRSSRFKNRADLLDGFGALLIESIQQENLEFFSSLNRVLLAARDYSAPFRNPMRSAYPSLPAWVCNFPTLSRWRQSTAS